MKRNKQAKADRPKPAQVSKGQRVLVITSDGKRRMQWEKGS